MSISMRSRLRRYCGPRSRVTGRETLACRSAARTRYQIRQSQIHRWLIRGMRRARSGRTSKLLCGDMQVTLRIPAHGGGLAANDRVPVEGEESQRALEEDGRLGTVHFTSVDLPEGA